MARISKAPRSTDDLADFDANVREQVEAELVAGANVTITPAGSGATRTLVISATGGAGGGSGNTYFPGGW